MVRQQLGDTVPSVLYVWALRRRGQMFWSQTGSLIVLFFTIASAAEVINSNNNNCWHSCLQKPGLFYVQYIRLVSVHASQMLYCCVTYVSQHQTTLDDSDILQRSWHNYIVFYIYNESQTTKCYCPVKSLKVSHTLTTACVPSCKVHTNRIREAEMSDSHILSFKTAAVQFSVFFILRCHVVTVCFC